MKKSQTDIKILFLAGSWNEFGGSESDYMNKFYRSLMIYLVPSQIEFHNGGTLEELKSYVSNNKQYDFIFNYANYNFSRHGHLKLRLYHKGSIITSFRKENHSTLSSMKSYILNSKSDFLVELGKDDYSTDYSTRIIDSHGVIISDYTEDLISTIGRLINESLYKVNSKKIRIYRDERYELYPSDIALMQNVSVTVKNSFRGNIIRAFSTRIPERYIMTMGKRVNLSSRVLTTNRSWNYRNKLYGKDISTLYYDERIHSLRYGGNTPSSESYLHEMLYELSDNIDYIIRTDNYYEESVFTPRIPVTNTLGFASLVAQTYLSTNSPIISIPGQGSFVLLSNLFKLPKMTLSSGPSEFKPSYHKPSYHKPSENSEGSLILDNYSIVHDDVIERHNTNGTYSIVDYSDINPAEDKIRVM